jgi:hypothetical protein
MSDDWDGRVFGKDGFDDDRGYDQAFGKEGDHKRHSSTARKGRKTRFKETIEYEGERKKTMKNGKIVALNNSGLGQSRNARALNKNKSQPSSAKRSKTPKANKHLVPGKDLGPKVREDLAFAAKMKLGVDLKKPEGIYQFWLNQIMVRKLPTKYLNKTLAGDIKNTHRSPSGAKRETSTQPEPKTEKYKKLHRIYEEYKHSLDADIWTSINNAFEKEQKVKERDGVKKKAMMVVSINEDAEQVVRNEIQVNFIRYMTKKILEQIKELNQKSLEIEDIRVERKKKDKREKWKASIDNRDKSPSKFPSKPRSKSRSKKGSKDDIEKKYTDEDIETFEYNVQRGLMEDTNKLLAKIYANLVFKSRSHHVGFTNDDEKLLLVWQDQKHEKMKENCCKSLVKIYEKYDIMEEEARQK